MPALTSYKMDSPEYWGNRAEAAGKRIAEEMVTDLACMPHESLRVKYPGLKMNNNAAVLVQMIRGQGSEGYDGMD